MASTLQWNSKVVVITIIAGVIILYAGSSLIRLHQNRQSSNTKVPFGSGSGNSISASLQQLGIDKKLSALPDQLKKTEQVKPANPIQNQVKKLFKSEKVEKIPPKMSVTVRAADTEVEKPIPPGYLSTPDNKLPDVAIEELTVTIETGGKKVDVFYREVQGKKFPLLFLHGMAFSSKNWVDVHTVQMAARMGHRVVAVDLPGFGKSKDSEVSKNKGLFLADLIHQLGLSGVVIVSPSMSGGYSLPYVLQRQGPTAEKLKAFIPVAPVKSDSFKAEEYQGCKVPVLIVYGSRDERLGVHGAEHLKDFDNHLIHIIKDAGHAAWKEKSLEWNTAVYNFLTLLDKGHK